VQLQRPAVFKLHFNIYILKRGNRSRSRENPLAIVKPTVACTLLYESRGNQWPSFFAPANNNRKTFKEHR